MVELLGQIESAGAIQRFEFAGLPERGWIFAGLALLLALCYGVFWLYRREGRAGASMRVRMFLGIVRCLVILLLAAIWLEPVLATYHRRWIDSYTLVLADESASMALEDHYRQPELAERIAAVLPGASAPLPRTQVANRVLAGGADGLLGRLAGRNRVQVYTFSDRLRLRQTLERTDRATTQPATRPAGVASAPAVTTAPAIPPIEATGPATNIGQAVRRAVELAGTAPLSGIVVLGDGAFNQGEAPAAVGRFAASREVPIYAIGIGDPSEPQNARVLGLEAPQAAFLKDPFKVTAQMIGQGMAGQRLPVQLYEKRGGGEGLGRMVATETVLVRGDGRPESVSFERTVDQPGAVQYTVRIPPQPYETLTDDNTRSAGVQMLEAKIRVLLVAGSPTYDYRFLARQLERDAVFDLSCWLQSAGLRAIRDGNTVIDHLPITPKELFVYDVIVLMDPQLNRLPSDWLTRVNEFVGQRGGGLCFQAGRKYTAEIMRHPRGAPLRDVLPVAADAQAEWLLNQLGPYQKRTRPVQIERTAWGNAVLSQSTDPIENERIWQRLGRTYWFFPVLRQKPAATVLARVDDPRFQNKFGKRVLMASQFYGPGRSAYIGFDGTWRWRRYGEQYFNRFWVQTLRWLAEGKLLGGRKRAVLQLTQQRYSIGSAVVVTAMLLRPDFQPVVRPSVTAYYRIGEGVRRPVELTAKPNQPGRYEGRFIPQTTGPCTIELELDAVRVEDRLKVSQQVSIVQPNLEVERPQMDRAALTELAESAGGRYLEVDQIDTLPALIPDRHEEPVVAGKPRTLWDRWWVLGLLVGLLSLEWAVRKRARML